MLPDISILQHDVQLESRKNHNCKSVLTVVQKEFENRLPNWREFFQFYENWLKNTQVVLPESHWKQYKTKEPRNHSLILDSNVHIEVARAQHFRYQNTKTNKSKFKNSSLLQSNMASKLFCVEFPGNVQNVDKMVDCLVILILQFHQKLRENKEFFSNFRVVRPL